MTTIDQVIAANEALVAAIENHTPSFKPMKHFGMSFAMEEAQEDVKAEGQAGVWEKFKAFIKRIKDWFIGLFQKRKEKLSKIEELEKTVDVKKEMDIKAKLDEAVKAEETSTAPAATTQAAPAPAASPATEPSVSKGAQTFQSKRTEIIAETKNIIKGILVEKFGGEFSSIARIIMSDNSSGDDTKIGRKISDAFSEVSGRFQAFGRVLQKIEDGENLGVSGFDEIQKSISIVNEIVNGSDVGQAWVNNVSQHSTEDLIKAYNRYCGFVLDINQVLNTRYLRNIEKSLGDVTAVIDKFAEQGKGTPEAIELVRKTYAESIVPASSALSKVIGIYASALEQAVKNEHLIGKIRDAGVQATRKVLGEEQTKHTSRIVIGAMLNDVMNAGK